MLVLRSMELARAADDRVLLGRCYINVPAHHARAMES